MLIINADDLGYGELVTDRILECFGQELITAASSMVFMKDSRRAADRARASGLETGLHLNLTQPFTGPGLSIELRDRHLKAVSYFRAGKWAVMIYNPFLRKDIDFVYKAQYDEFVRLYESEPAHFDGHHHIHLSMNVILGNRFPARSYVRRSLTFGPGEKTLANRSYRRLTDAWLLRRYRSTESFVSVEPEWDIRKLKRTVEDARRSSVELAVHPGDDRCYDFLMAPGFREIISGAPKATHQMLA